MVLPVNVIAAFVTVVLRGLFRRLPLLESPVLQPRTSSYFVNPQLAIAGSVVCYLSRRQCREWFNRARSYSRLKFQNYFNHDRIPHISRGHIAKAKLCLDNTAQASKKLQQSAILFMENYVRSSKLGRFDQNQSASQFVHAQEGNSHAVEEPTPCDDAVELEHQPSTSSISSCIKEKPELYFDNTEAKKRGRPKKTGFFCQKSSSKASTSLAIDDGLSDRLGQRKRYRASCDVCGLRSMLHREDQVPEHGYVFKVPLNDKAASVGGTPTGLLKPSTRGLHFGSGDLVRRTRSGRIYGWRSAHPPKSPEHRS